jgi:ferredoxin-fold anticodon binding domain-containing protein
MVSATKHRVKSTIVLTTVGAVARMVDISQHDVGDLHFHKNDSGEISLKIQIFGSQLLHFLYQSKSSLGIRIQFLGASMKSFVLYTEPAAIY